MTARKKLLKNQAGAAMIEFLILVMVMILIAFGSVNFTLALCNLQVAADATMTGVAWGANSSFHSALFGGTTATGWNGPQSIEAAVSNAIVGLGTTSTVQATNYCTCVPGGSSVACNSPCMTNNVADQPMTYVMVVTTTTFYPIFKLPGLPQSFKLTDTSVMQLY